MQFTPLAIPEVVLITPRLFEDSRGYFLEAYKQSVFHANGITEDFVQDNHSLSSKDTLRGLHYQREPQAQGKLVRCPVGKIMDIAVDIRQGSPTYGQWVQAILDETTQTMLYVPPGFAHGFVVLSDQAHVHYKTTHEYAPDLDDGIRWNDPDIGVIWPVDTPLLSKKDQHLPYLNEMQPAFSY